MGGLVRLLKSSHKEALRNSNLCEDYSDLTSPTSNYIPNIDITTGVKKSLVLVPGTS